MPFFAATVKFISEQGLIPGSICDFFLFEFQKVVENIYMSCKFFPVKAGSSACQDCIFAWKDSIDMKEGEYISML